MQLLVWPFLAVFLLFFPILSLGCALFGLNSCYMKITILLLKVGIKVSPLRLVNNSIFVLQLYHYLAQK